MSTTPDLSVKAINIKLSAGAHARAKDIAVRHNLKLQDVMSMCLIHMDEAEMVRRCREHAAAVEAMPKSVRNVLANIHKLSDAEREGLRNALA